MDINSAVTSAAFRYYGAKWGLAPWIISHFPQHAGYVEPCGGSAAVLLRKPVSVLETFNDLDLNIVNFFKVLRENTDELVRRIMLTPYSRVEFEVSKHASRERYDDIEMARLFFVGSWMSISSTAFSSSGWRSSSFARQTYVSPSHQMDKARNALMAIADRFKYVQIENRDALYVIERYGMREGTLVYFDPPYTRDTRVSKSQYAIEVDDGFHMDAADLLSQSSGFVVVSGYASELYRSLYEERGWTRIDKQSKVNGGKYRTESLWLSPSVVSKLGIRSQQALF